MIVEQIWTGNAYRNFNYLIACPETGEAMAIDPLDHEKCLAMAKVRGWQITQVLNTHEHFDQPHQVAQHDTMLVSEPRARQYHGRHARVFHVYCKTRWNQPGLARCYGQHMVQAGTQIHTSGPSRCIVRQGEISSQSRVDYFYLNGFQILRP